MISISRPSFRGDKYIWSIVIFLMVISVWVVYSSTTTLAYLKSDGNTEIYLFKQVGFCLFALGCIYVIHNLNYRFWARFSQVFYLLGGFLLVITLFLGTNINNANRWLKIGGMSIQSSDVARIFLSIWLAKQITARQDKMDDYKKGAMPILLGIGLYCFLILIYNFSTAAMVAVVSLLVLIVGRVPFRHLARSLLLVGFVGILAIGIMYVAKIGRASTWVSRVENFISPDEEEGFQAMQAKVAIATGGIAGKGPGHSTQRNFLPFPFSDFIYAIILEEYGLLGGGAIILLYLFLFYRCMVVAKKGTRGFASYLVMALAISMVIQALINMIVAVGLGPVTGQTLPFVSLGGSSLISSSIAIGIILSVSREQEENPSLTTREVSHAD